MDTSLHPNLARIAARHDEIVAAFQRGQLTPEEARRQVLALVARDDTGVEWSIAPDTGMWRYRSHWGEQVTAEPPAYGVVGLTPEAIGAAPEEADQDGRVSFYEVDTAALKSDGQLRGSTLLDHNEPPDPPAARRWLLLAAAGSAAAAVAAALVS